MSPGPTPQAQRAPTASNNGERTDILAIMPPEDPNDHYLNFVIEGIKTLVRLEPGIPSVWSQHKIEHRYRLYSQRIQYCEIYERPGALDPRIVAWAKDVAGGSRTVCSCMST
jgi:hypothetical protein